MARKSKQKNDAMTLIVDSAVKEHLENSTLTESEKEFCLNFVSSYNAAQSYRKAYDFKGSIYKSRILAYAVLHKPHIQSEVKRLKEILSYGLDIDSTAYVRFLAEVAQVDIGDYLTFGTKEIPVMTLAGPALDADGNQIMKTVNNVELIDSSILDTALISEIKQGRDGVSIKLQDKKWAWDRLREFFHWGEQKVVNADDNSNTFINALQGKTSEAWDSNEDDSNEITKET